MAKSSGETMIAILEKAVENYAKEKFWQDVDEAYQRLKKNPQLWQEELEERNFWEQTLSDGETA